MTGFESVVNSAPARGGTPSSIVVVGASHSAIQMAEALRAAGYLGAVRLIGDEPHQPYQRPALSKAYLKGDATAESLALRGPDWYAQNSIDLTLDRRAIRVERDREGAGIVHTVGPGGSAEASYSFDRLVLATGARPRRLALRGSDAEGVLELRNIDDAQDLVARVALGPVVVIGGGFIGLEAAATITGLGGSVTVLEAGPRLMGRAVGASTADFFYDAHRRSGMDVRLSSAPREIIVDDAGAVRGVRTHDADIPASTVLVGVGVEPNVELAECLGLTCAGGVVVDARCLASDGVTLAIGDCTVQPWPGEYTGERPRIRLESVDNAAEQAVAAAKTILGQPPSTRSQPWFWSDQGEWKLQIVGLTGHHDGVVSRVDADRPTRRVLGYFCENQLVAAECVNAPGDFLVLRAALNRGALVSPELFARNEVPLKKLLATARS